MKIIKASNLVTLEYSINDYINKGYKFIEIKIIPIKIVKECEGYKITNICLAFLSEEENV
jgi:hypothetical protein